MHHWTVFLSNNSSTLAFIFQRRSISLLLGAYIRKHLAESDDRASTKVSGFIMASRRGKVSLEGIRKLVDGVFGSTRDWPGTEKGKGCPLYDFFFSGERNVCVRIPCDRSQLSLKFLVECLTPDLIRGRYGARVISGCRIDMKIK